MSDEFQINTAVRKAAPVTIFVQGVSGSGKTYSSLLMARGLAGPGEKIGIIDTEGGRSLIYADDPKIGGFEHMRFEAPFSPDRFIRAADAAVKAGWKAIIIDSMSLEHDGEGGLLEMADLEAERLEEEAQKRGRENRAISQQKWTQPKLAHKRMLNHFCGLSAHIIGCFRETLTTDFDAKDERGNKKPATILSVVAEKNTLFSFDIHVIIDKDHRATWTRVPKPYLPAIKQGSLITVETGRLLAGQTGLQSGSAPTSKTDAVDAAIDTARENAIRDIETTLASEEVDPYYFNTVIAGKYAGKGDYQTIEALPTAHLIALAKPAKLNPLIAEAMELQRKGA